MQAVEAGFTEMTAAAAVDSWALGVMAYELLTRKPVFDTMAHPDAVRHQPPDTSCWT